MNTEENVKPPKRRVWETLFCCWRQRSVTITRRSKSQQNGTVDTQYQIHQTIGQASGLSSNGQNRYLLPQVRHQDMHRKCMVIDLDETLVHSSFKVSITNSAEFAMLICTATSADFLIWLLILLFLSTANSKCWFHRAGRNWWNSSSSLCP